MPLISEITGPSILEITPRAKPKRLPGAGASAAQWVVTRRLRNRKTRASTTATNWDALLDRCAADFGQRPGTQAYLAAVAEGRKRRRRPPVRLYRPLRKNPVPGPTKRLGMVFDGDTIILNDDAAPIDPLPDPSARHLGHREDYPFGLYPKEAEAAGRRPHLEKLVDQIKQRDGGFTVHATSGKVPTTGYALSVYKGRETVIPATKLTLKDLVSFAVKNGDLLAKDDNYFGAWNNPADGKVYMDVSKVVATAAEADRLGRENNQIAYFDLGKGQSVEVMKQAA